MSSPGFLFSSNDFSLRVDEHIARVHDGGSYLSSGLAFMPLLVNLALGDDGVTHDEILDVLKFPIDDDRVVKYQVSDDIRELLNTPFFSVNATNAIISTSVEKFTDEFIITSVEHFHTNPVHIVHADESQVSATMSKIINVQASDLKLPPMKPESLQTANMMNLAGLFKERFHPINTKPRAFVTKSGAEILIPTMSSRSTFPYTKRDDLGAEIVKIVYEGEEVYMYIIHPLEGHSLESVQSNLRKPGELQKAVESITPKLLDLSLPKFHIWSSTETTPLFSELGLNNMMREGFNNIIENNIITIGYGIQTISFSIDEDGVEYPRIPSSGAKLKSVKINHPFLFKMFKNDLELISGVFSPSE